MFESGILRLPQGAAAAGDVIPVGALLAYILQAGESMPAGGSQSPPQSGGREGQASTASPSATGRTCFPEAIGDANGCHGRARQSNHQPTGAASSRRAGGGLDPAHWERPHGPDRRAGCASGGGDDGCTGWGGHVAGGATNGGGSRPYSGRVGGDQTGWQDSTGGRRVCYLRHDVDRCLQRWLKRS